MTSPDENDRFEQGILLRFFTTFSVLIILLLINPPEISAQAAASSDPFEQQVPLELSEVTKALGQNNYNQALQLLSALRKDALKTRNKTLQTEIFAKIKEVNRLKTRI